MVVLGSASGQQENLSKVRLQTSSAEGWDMVGLSRMTHRGSPLSPCARPLGVPIPAGAARGAPALTRGRRHPAHVAVTFLLVGLPVLKEGICDLGGGALGTAQRSPGLGRGRRPLAPGFKDGCGQAWAEELCRAVPCRAMWVAGLGSGCCSMAW